MNKYQLKKVLTLVHSGGIRWVYPPLQPLADTNSLMVQCMVEENWPNDFGRFKKRNTGQKHRVSDPLKTIEFQPCGLKPIEVYSVGTGEWG